MPPSRIFTFYAPEADIAQLLQIALARDLSAPAGPARDFLHAAITARPVLARAIQALREDAVREAVVAGGLLPLTGQRRRRAEALEVLLALYEDLALGREPHAWLLDREVVSVEEQQLWQAKLAAARPTRRAAAEAALAEDLGHPPLAELVDAFAGDLRPHLLDSDDELEEEPPERDEVAESHARLEDELDDAVREVGKLRREINRMRADVEDALVHAASVAVDDREASNLVEEIERRLQGRDVILAPRSSRT